jgi:hypothetical protein
MAPMRLIVLKTPPFGLTETASAAPLHTNQVQEKRETLQHVLIHQPRKDFFGKALLRVFCLIGRKKNVTEKRRVTVTHDVDDDQRREAVLPNRRKAPRYIFTDCKPTLKRN